jgi:hypothetical protein
MDEEIKKFALTNQSFRIKINADSSIKLTQEQLISSERNAKILAQSAADGLRNITSVTKTKIVIVHDTITAPYTGDIDPLDTCINVGTKFYEASKYDTIQGQILSTGVQIIRSPYYLGDITTVIGSEKFGLFNLRSRPVVQTTFSNPNIKVISASNVVVQQKKRPMFNVSAGVGYGVGTDFKPRPFVGLTVGKTLFRF